MDTKIKNFFKAVSEIALFNMELHPQMLTSALEETLNYDFNTAVSLWEYYLEKYEPLFLRVPKANESLSVDALKVFYAKSEQKTLKTIVENAFLKKYLLGQSNVAFDLVVLNSVAGSIASGKTDVADDYLKFMVKHDAFDKIMLEILRLVREKLLAKQHGEIRLTPKQSKYLASYSAKIKSADKAVALQRIKEMS